MFQNIIEVLILSAIQGISEFLPISSSAHLILVSSLYEFKSSSLLIDISLHLGSLFAIVYFFREELLDIKNNQRLLTNSITPINDFLTQTLTKMKIYLEDSEAIGNIKSRLKKNGSSEVSICFLSVNDKVHKVELSLGKNFYIDSPILSSIKDISGVSKIEEI